MMRIEILPLSQWRRMTLAVFVLAFLAVCCGVPPAAGAKKKEGGSFAIPAWAFDRGNAKVSVNPDVYADYRDLHPELIAGDGGQTPWQVEYDVDLPAAAGNVGEKNEQIRSLEDGNMRNDLAGHGWTDTGGR